MSSEKVRKEFLGLGHVGWRRFTVSHLDIEIVVQLHLIILSTLPPGYHFGLVKLEVKSKTSSGVEFTAGGNTTTDGGKVVKIFSAQPFCLVCLANPKEHSTRTTDSAHFPLGHWFP